MIKRQRGEDPVTLEQFADDNDLDIIITNYLNSKSKQLIKVELVKDGKVGKHFSDINSYAIMETDYESVAIFRLAEIINGNGNLYFNRIMYRVPVLYVT